MNIEYYTAYELKRFVQKNKKNFVEFFKYLKTNNPKNINTQFHKLHNEAFEKFSCLSCANCCSGISPIILQNDINKIAKHLKIKPSVFLQEYLYMDEDGDFVFVKTPCPFLCTNNYCKIYENRPKACKEYPHTNHQKMLSILDITLKNCEICPIVYGIICELIKQQKSNTPQSQQIKK